MKVWSVVPKEANRTLKSHFPYDASNEVLEKSDQPEHGATPANRSNFPSAESSRRILPVWANLRVSRDSLSRRPLWAASGAVGTENDDDHNGNDALDHRIVGTATLPFSDNQKHLPREIQSTRSRRLHGWQKAEQHQTPEAVMAEIAILDFLRG